MPVRGLSGVLILTGVLAFTAGCASGGGAISDVLRGQDPATPGATVYTTADGRFSMGVPPGWYVSREGTAPNGWFIVTIRPGAHSHPTDGTEGEVAPHEESFLYVEGRPDDTAPTLSELGAELCQPVEGLGEPLACGTVELNGVTWTRALVRVSLGARNVAVGTVADGMVYRAVATVADGPRQARTFDTASDIIATFEIHR